MKNPDLLWEYQCLEPKKAQLHKQLKTFSEVHELRKLKEQIEKSQELIRNISQEKENFKKYIKNRELEVLNLKEKLANAESELYGGNVQASREIAAAEKNISIIKQKIKEEEDGEFAAMEKLEQTETSLEPLLRELQEKKNLFRKINQEYSDKKEKILKDIEEIKNRQDDITQKIDPGDWEAYSKLCEKYPDKSGVAILQGGICSGCHMSVSYELLKKAKEVSSIVCDNCGRHLIVR